VVAACRPVMTWTVAVAVVVSAQCAVMKCAAVKSRLGAERPAERGGHSELRQQSVAKTSRHQNAARRLSDNAIQ